MAGPQSGNQHSNQHSNQGNQTNQWGGYSMPPGMTGMPIPPEAAAAMFAGIPPMAGMPHHHPQMQGNPGMHLPAMQPQKREQLVYSKSML